MVEVAQHRHRDSAAVGEVEPCEEPATVAALLPLEEGASRGLSSLLLASSGSVRLSSGPRRVKQVRSATSGPRWRLPGFRVVLFSCALLPLQIVAVASAQRVPSGRDVETFEKCSKDCSNRVVVGYPGGETLSDRIASIRLLRLLQRRLQVEISNQAMQIVRMESEHLRRGSVVARRLLENADDQIFLRLGDHVVES